MQHDGQDLKQQMDQILQAPISQPVGVGILTTLDRDKWADVHAELEKVSKGREISAREWRR